MSSIGKFISIPRQNYQWGQFRDEYGNSWNIRKEDFPRGKEVGDSMAYRLDFSDPKGSPRIVEDDS